MKYDIIVIGAGTAGAMTACRAAQQGLSIALIDRKLKQKIGNKTCGDALAKYHMDFVKSKVGFDHPKGEELKQKITGLALYPPNKKSKIILHDQEGYVVDRLLFGQRLLNLAIDSGTELFSDYVFKDLIIKENKIIGVKIKSKKTKESEDIFANVITDASGANSIIRKKIPNFLQKWTEKEISNVDIGYAYRKIINLDNFNHIEDIDLIQIYFDHKLARGGYAWVFPRGQKSANVGIGGIKIMTSDLHEKYNQFFANFPELNYNTVIHEGGGLIPMRRPMNSFVTDNFAFVGDAAFQVNPLHGGGIGANLEAGVFLADTVIEANENNDFSEQSLWQYNIKYNNKIGCTHAALDIFRLYAYIMPNKVLNAVINRKIITENDVMSAGLTGALEMTAPEKLKKALKGMDIFKYMLKIRTMAKKMGIVKELYQNYPKESKEMPDWIEKINNIYQGLKEPYENIKNTK